ncbi:MAG: hypothetical protein QOF33_1352 [Thermomicrobiales bacterium]|jgi:hypothetical protein|nr:hypothetical protein [Thermomicrobiales bacterium]
MEAVVSVIVLRPYVLHVTFADGTVREVDMEPDLWGEMFEPLRDPANFAQAAVDPELQTGVWPNGADICAHVLYWGSDGPPWARELAHHREVVTVDAAANR